MRRLPFCTLAARERLAAASPSLPSSLNERNGGDTIAIYHCSIKIVSRGKGKSAVAAAAYRSGEKLTNEWDGLTHDYTKKGGVVHSEILLPAHAPPAFSDRSTLWNRVELSEKSNNAQLAREVEIALPVELSREEQTRLVREYCSSQFVSKGMIADFNLHDTGGGNPHAHILLTMRPLDERGAWLPKSKKEYVLDENGEKIRLPSGRYKTRKVDLVDWNSQFTPSELSDFVPGFLDDGTAEDGRLLVFPVSKSTQLLMCNGSGFARFSQATGVSYADLSTWEGFYDAAGKFYDWSGKPFCALDYPIRAVELCAMEHGSGDFYTENGWYDTNNAVFKESWMQFACALAQGMDLADAVNAGKAYLTGALAAGFDMGRGSGPVNHMWQY